MMTAVERNKALVLEAMSALFRSHDPLAVERLYARDYIQHNPDIPQGRDALAQLVAQLPPTVFYEPGLIIAEGDFVAIHGRIRGWAPKPQIAISVSRTVVSPSTGTYCRTKRRQRCRHPAWPCSLRMRARDKNRPDQTSRPKPWTMTA